VKRTDNYSTEYISSDYYSTLVEARMEANYLLTQLEFSEDPDIQKRFKQVMSFLTKEMLEKYQRREDVEKPDAIQEVDFIDMQELDVNDCRKVLASIRDLQEKLGITSMARNDYEMDEKGAVKKK
jgi:hypothetical protein